MEYNNQQQQTLTQVSKKDFDYGDSFRIASDENKALADDISCDTMLKDTFQELRKNEVVAKPFAANTAKEAAAGVRADSQSG
ncbi:hypothetical protein DL770_008952 [Monosporascus sp. CRB-9-2]|nr:hypothetical protein DL770_008952 [Monosporascus sp. CRB-9-2]